MRGSGVTVALFALFFAISAHAQVPGYAPPPMPYPPGVHLFPIVVEGHPSDLKVTLSTEEYGKPFLYCEGRCEALAYDGDYWLSVRGSHHTLPGKREIRLKQSSVIHVRAQRRDEDSAVGIVGFSLLLGGLGLSAYGVSRADQPDAGNSAGASLLLGLGSIAAGIVLVIVSAARDGDEKDPDISIEP